jgi:hypothetical protein
MLVNVIEHGVCAQVIIMAGVYKARFIQLMPVKCGAFIKGHFFAKAIHAEVENAINVFLYVAGSISSNYRYLILGKGVFLNYKMINVYSICEYKTNYEKYQGAGK